jgi:hypothetical protein
MTRNLDYYSMDVAGDLGQLWKYSPQKKEEVALGADFSILKKLQDRLVSGVSLTLRVDYHAVRILLWKFLLI